MTIIVHPVGQGDLGNDIVRLRGNARKEAQKEAEQEFRELLKAEDSERLLEKLLEAPAGGSRFNAPPLSLILRALAPAEGELPRSVTVLLLASRSGDPGTRTWEIGELLKKALGLAGVHDGLQEELRLDVSAEMCEANLLETAGVEELAERLRCLVDSQNQTGDEPKVVVNAISGASMIALGAMGAADQFGLDWRAAVAPGAEKDTAVLLDRSSYDTAPFYWLLSLGYIEQARKWEQERLVGSAGRASVDVGSLDDLTDLMNRLATNPESLSDKDLASLLALDMARADNGAGLIARAWAQKHYLVRHHEEIEAGMHTLDDLVTVAKGARGKSPMLGEIICAAEKRQQELKDECPESVRWLLEHQWLNDVGKGAVHDIAAPSASDVKQALSLDEITSHLPDWVARPEWRPGRGTVLFIAPCGAGAPRDKCVTERILGKEPDKKIRRAVPGAMLDGAGPLPIEFLLLHSSDLRSKKTSLDAAAASSNTQVNAGWERHTPIFVDLCDYGGGNGDEYAATPAIMRIVSGQVALALEAKRPAAVVIVGTGQKAVVLGALQGAQKWCAEHATPLFLQTFVDRQEREDGIPQLHRFALHNDAETALREAAISSLKSLNLLSAVRVLAAGDRDMDELADRCDKLRQQLLDVANDKKNPDRGAGVLIDLLQTVAGLWTEATELTKMRLAVVVAEALNFKTKGSNLLHRNNNLEGVGGGPINLARPYPKDCDKKRSKDKGAHQDLLEILYRVRNKLVVTHADDIVKSALQMVLQDLGGANIETASTIVSGDDVTYPVVLRLTCEKLEEAAVALNITWEPSTWKAEFDSLMSELKPRAHTREP